MSEYTYRREDKRDWVRVHGDGHAIVDELHTVRGCLAFYIAT